MLLLKDIIGWLMTLATDKRHIGTKLGRLDQGMLWRAITEDKEYPLGCKSWKETGLKQGGGTVSDLNLKLLETDAIWPLRIC